MSDVVNNIRKVAEVVYLACDSSVAADIAIKCKNVADSHDKLVEDNKLLRDTLLSLSKGNMHPIDLNIMINEVLTKTK